MPIPNEINAVMHALHAIGGVLLFTRGWPKSFAKLPCIAVSEAGSVPYLFRDDKPYITELSYYVRVFGAVAEENDRIADEVDGIMTGLRYVCTLRYEDDNPEVRQKVLRYRKYV